MALAGFGPAALAETRPALATSSVHGGAGSPHYARRFDRVERLVHLRYYAPSLHGVDWAELCARFRPRAAAAADDAAWYGTVNAMLRELHDIHTRVEPPGLPERGGGRASRYLSAGAVVEPASKVMPGGAIYLRFDKFDTDTVRWIGRQLAAHAGAPGIVLDLRHNSGGLIKATQRAAGLFFPRDVPMGVAIDRQGRRSLERSIGGSPRSYAGPLAVLVGPGSRSSAEVFADVLQHHRRAAIVGRNTAGAVLGVRSFRLRDGGRLFVSVSDFERLDGGRLEGRGVSPDVRVTPSVVGAELDGNVPNEALAAAVGLVQGGD